MPSDSRLRLVHSLSVPTSNTFKTAVECDDLVSMLHASSAKSRFETIPYEYNIIAR